MRLLKKLIRKLYHLIWFLGAFVLFLPIVNAEQGIASTNGQKFVVPFAATFADNSNDHLTRVSAGFNSSEYRYYSTSITLNGRPTYGAAVIFDGLEPFVAGYTYVVSLLLNTNSNDVLQNTSSRICVAETLNNAITRYNNTVWPCTNAIYMTHTTGKPNPFHVDNTSNNFNYNILTYVFTPDFTGTSITFNFNTTDYSTFSYVLFFGGYSSTLLSDNKNLTQQQITSAVQNSGLATANSVAQVQQRANEIKQELSGVQQQQQQTNQKLDDVNNNLTDETAPGLDLSDLEVSSDTPISDLITMPLTILNSLVQALDGACSNYTIPFFYNNSITFPCFTISDYLGNTVTNYIDLFICFYMCYNIGMLVISVFEDITSLRDIYDSMYVPKHADTGYQPKHAKGGGD